MTTMIGPTYWAKQLNDGASDTVPRRISNSEVSAYLQCERKWLYGYHQLLEPVNTSMALSRGIIAHEMLAEYYRTLMASGTGPKNYKAAENNCWEVWRPYFTTGQDADMLVGLKTLIERYFAWSQEQDAGWKILAVEQSYDIDVNDEFGYVMRLDLLAEINGETVLIDHKTVWDFHDANSLDMNCQVPKYVGTLRLNDIKVDYAMLNQIRYRTKKAGNTDEETFQRVIMRPTKTEIKNVLSEQFRASQQIIKLYADPEPVILRTMNNMTCKNCGFAKLCKADLMGQPTDEIRRTEYRPNSYGYNKVPAVTP